MSLEAYLWLQAIISSMTLVGLLLAGLCIRNLNRAIMAQNETIRIMQGRSPAPPRRSAS